MQSAAAKSAAGLKKVSQQLSENEAKIRSMIQELFVLLHLSGALIDSSNNILLENLELRMSQAESAMGSYQETHRQVAGNIKEEDAGIRTILESLVEASSSLKGVTALVEQQSLSTKEVFSHITSATENVDRGIEQSKNVYVVAERMVGMRLSRNYFQGSFEIISESIEQIDVVCLAHENRQKPVNKINDQITKMQSSAAVAGIMDSYLRS